MVGSAKLRVSGDPVA